MYNYFLSRPRRFGKSLLLDTIKEVFEGNEPLFQGLTIHDQWDWTASSTHNWDVFPLPTRKPILPVAGDRNVFQAGVLP
jgi:hypothetical protein